MDFFSFFLATQFYLWWDSEGSSNLKQDQIFTSTMKDRLSWMLKYIISCNPFPFLIEYEDFWKIGYFVVRIQYLLVYKIEVAALFLVFFVEFDLSLQTVSVDNFT